MQTISESECDNDSNDELEPKLDVVCRFEAWSEDLDKEPLDPLPADTANDSNPFIPGCMGSMTVNYVLIVKGQIDPSVGQIFSSSWLHHHYNHFQACSKQDSNITLFEIAPRKTQNCTDISHHSDFLNIIFDVAYFWLPLITKPSAKGITGSCFTEGRPFVFGI